MIATCIDVGIAAHYHCSPDDSTVEPLSNSLGAFSKKVIEGTFIKI